MTKHRGFGFGAMVAFRSCWQKQRLRIYRQNTGQPQPYRLQPTTQHFQLTMWQHSGEAQPRAGLESERSTSAFRAILGTIDHVR